MQSLLSDSFTRGTNVAPYSISDDIGPSVGGGAGVTITAGTNASPIVLTGATHGLLTGDWITVAGVGGLTAANGVWQITKVDANSFSLNQSAGNSAYTSGGTAARIMAFKNVVAASLTVTAASNASPIVVTTSASHGLASGRQVSISGVLGNGAANGTWTITVLTPTTFSLNGSTGNGTYSSGGTVVPSGSIQNTWSGAFGSVNRARLAKTSGVITDASFRLYLYRAPPTVQVDNAAAVMANADNNNMIGWIDFVAQTEGSGGSFDILSETVNVEIGPRVPIIFGRLIAKGAYVPAASEVFDIELVIDN